MCLNIAIKLVVYANYHDIAQLLLLMIIASSKNYMISINSKENITINRQNWLIVHHYLLVRFLCTTTEMGYVAFCQHLWVSLITGSAYCCKLFYVAILEPVHRRNFWLRENRWMALNLLIFPSGSAQFQYIYFVLHTHIVTTVSNTCLKAFDWSLMSYQNIVWPVD